MNAEEIHKHWVNWANEFGKDLRATTRTSTAKILEVDALARVISSTGLDQQNASVLEVGCGNGHNCFELAKIFPNFTFTGIDYVQEMIDAAEALKSELNVTRTRFSRGDVLRISDSIVGDEQFDIVFTVRCLINLNSHELQIQALDQLISKVKPGGRLILIENSKLTHGNQNDLRASVGLDRRKPAEFNRFLDEDEFVAHASKSLTLVGREDFSSLHDLILYVLVPMINEGKIDYAHPLVHAATRLSIETSRQFNQAFGPFGQNRLLHFAKKK
ncbi:MAG: class I SAM-dependent methyltransferase [Leptospirales bacterium]|nr:class I SAM-dependent methyltransferase [Leptospirales bacterium]